MLESRLENSEFKKTMLEEENTEILRRTADFVELERLKRENAERELDLVEKELQNINNKSYLGKKREFVNKYKQRKIMRFWMKSSQNSEEQKS